LALPMRPFHAQGEKEEEHQATDQHSF